MITTIIMIIVVTKIMAKVMNMIMMKRQMWVRQICQLCRCRRGVFQFWQVSPSLLDCYVFSSGIVCCFHSKIFEFDTNQFFILLQRAYFYHVKLFLLRKVQKKNRIGKYLTEYYCIGLRIFLHTLAITICSTI